MALNRSASGIRYRAGLLVGAVLVFDGAGARKLEFWKPDDQTDEEFLTMLFGKDGDGGEAAAWENAIANPPALELLSLELVDTKKGASSFADAIADAALELEA